ncbi:hypothetical protein [Nocardiopsis sp. Huas11]|uniref:hypothetical protein n=1 Tax=Nocardiopsis sp. Huas11 TaxID=2183912 RepID=UPI0011C44935|nr:hypothetical protein [Nocardiopsis sp. Huas11]
MSYSRMRQGGLFASGLAIRTEQDRKKQDIAYAMLRERVEVVDRKQQVVDSMVAGQDGPAKRDQLQRLDGLLEAQAAKTAQEYERIDRETDERMREHRRWRRLSLVFDSVLIALSVVAMVSILVMDLGAWPR